MNLGWIQQPVVLIYLISCSSCRSGSSNSLVMHASSYMRWSFLPVAYLTRTWSDRRPHAHKRDSMSTTCSHCRKRTATATGGAGLSRYYYPQLVKCQSALCSGFSWELFTPCCLPRVYWWRLRSQTWEGGGGGAGRGAIPNATLSSPQGFLH